MEREREGRRGRKEREMGERERGKERGGRVRESEREGSHESHFIKNMPDFVTKKE